ncbi:ras family-domain-containing protein [Jimgerdemannia flammicorona]|uniref:Ras family-domain-containing protein n=1 Tax=Jimgerdemannia flammicorona TaxID=994334 RepID=A0A433QH67_9FUNG|nr:ras family-domain-containing protein [Jimgerdemannia flammicorona]
MSHYVPSSSGSTLEAKVVILGSQGVGKTSLVVRYIEKTFSPNCTATIGASFMAKKLSVDNCKVRLQIWDTAGQERFRSMAPMYYRGAHAAILVYDITQEQSFLDMNSWVEDGMYFISIHPLPYRAQEEPDRLACDTRCRQQIRPFLHAPCCIAQTGARVCGAHPGFGNSRS